MMTWQSEFLALHIYLLEWDHSTNRHVLSDANKHGPFLQAPGE